MSVGAPTDKRQEPWGSTLVRLDVRMAFSFLLRSNSEDSMTLQRKVWLPALRNYSSGSGICKFDPLSSTYRFSSKATLTERLRCSRGHADFLFVCACYSKRHSYIVVSVVGSRSEISPLSLTREMLRRFNGISQQGKNTWTTASSRYAVTLPHRAYCRSKVGHSPWPSASRFKGTRQKSFGNRF